jgi:hypothetical protein
MAQPKKGARAFYSRYRRLIEAARLPIGFAFDHMMGFKLASSDVYPMLEVHESWHSACKQGKEVMTKQAEKSRKQQPQSGVIQDINQDRWSTFLAEFTRENRGAHARLEVMGPDVGYQVQTEDRPFDGVSADTKDGECAVWISFGSTSEDHLTHGIQNVRAIRVRPPAGQSGAAVEMIAQDGTTTLLELSRPEAYAISASAQ